ncbi:MAG: hypothetical protein LBV63_02915 [Candidatus Methanoplasma sp.]|jgi:hypothetical protein|nr:hypothetical protein [Candidatus Methanoplasma sp.]
MRSINNTIQRNGAISLIAVIVIAAIVIVAAVGVFFVINNDPNNGDGTEIDVKISLSPKEDVCVMIYVDGVEKEIEKDIKAGTAQTFTKSISYPISEDSKTVLVKAVAFSKSDGDYIVAESVITCDLKKGEKFNAVLNLEPKPVEIDYTLSYYEDVPGDLTITVNGVLIEQIKDLKPGSYKGKLTVNITESTDEIEAVARIQLGPHSYTESTWPIDDVLPGHKYNAIFMLL